MIEDKLKAIFDACMPLIGSTIERFETAEIRRDDGTWDDWPDLPIRIYCDRGLLLSVSWSRFDELWLSNDTALPFPVDHAATRWRTNGIDELRPAIGRRIQRVWLGRGDMSIQSREIEIWTRLVFDLGGRWFEVFNALDENGYALHSVEPEGDFRVCA